MAEINVLDAMPDWLAYRANYIEQEAVWADEKRFDADLADDPTAADDWADARDEAILDARAIDAEWSAWS